MASGVIFDLDGTLIDTESLALSTGLAVVRDHGFAVPEAVMHQLIGRDLATGDLILRAACPDLDIAALHAKWSAAFETAMTRDGLPLKPGAVDLLARLDRPLALCTSSQRASAQRKLAMTGLQAYFAHIVVREDVTSPKPHPEPYLLAASLLGLPPAECVAFEDSEAGAQSAQTAGCRVVQVPDILPTQGQFADIVAPNLLDGARRAGIIA
ncbi:HAD family hydrolase [Gemmobacter denitrificans]|uniref:HAD family phosphatase n=1 Tax=Gemmobacter denitrificans TaxID=3123040 RepID=A0ABU8BTM9_9RHOB